MNNNYLLEYLDTQKTAISYENYIYEIVGESGYEIPRKTLKKIATFRQDKQKMKLLYYATKKLIKEINK